MILVAGGTGTLGHLLTKRLQDRNVPVRILTRDVERARAASGDSVQVVQGDVRDASSLMSAAEGVDFIVSAVHGFAGPGGVSPKSVDEQGNMNLIAAAERAGAGFLLISIVGASPNSPMELLRAKYRAEEYLKRSALSWTILRATAFTETWAMVMGEPLLAKGQTMVFGRGENPVNFVSAIDVAALAELIISDSGLRGQTIELGGSQSLSFSEFARTLQSVTSREGKVRHTPRAALRTMSVMMSRLKPALARQAAAAVAMDTLDMTFDSGPTRRRFPQLPDTDVPTALRSYFGSRLH